MARTKSRFVCQECGYVASSWLGRCPECGGWNTLGGGGGGTDYFAVIDKQDYQNTMFS